MKWPEVPKEKPETAMQIRLLTQIVLELGSGDGLYQKAECLLSSKS